MDIGLKRRDDKEKEARDAIDVAKKERGTMQQFLTDRLHVVYRPGNANDAMERLVAQQRDVLPEVALFDSMVKDAVAITPETRKVDPTTKEHCRRFAESRLFFHLQCLADGDAEEDRLLEHCAWRGRSRRSRTAGEIHVLLHTPALHLYGRRARARGDVLHAVLAAWAPHGK